MNARTGLEVPTPATGHLRPTLKLHQMFTLGFGATIGVGWVTMLGTWIGAAGSIGAALAFGGGALVMMLIALCYAELSSMFPESGGDMIYAHESFGAAAAFAVGWLLLLIFLAIMVFLSISASWVIAELVPGWRGPVLYSVLGAGIAAGDLFTAAVGIVAMAVLNLRGGASAARFQDLATLALCVAACGFIGAGLLAGDGEHLAPGFANGDAVTRLMGVATVFATTPLWYAGFNVVPQAIGERSPGVEPRMVAQTMLLGLLAAMIFYVLLIISASMALPRDDLLALSLPAAGAFSVVLGSGLVGKAVLVAGLLGLVTSWNAVFFAATRVLYAMGRARLLPARFAVLGTRYRAPVAAIVLIATAGLALIPLGVGFIGPLVSTAGTALAGLFLLAALTVIYLRRARPDAPRPFRVPAAPIVAGLAATTSLAMIVVNVLDARGDETSVVPLEVFMVVGWLAAGLAAWRRGRPNREAIDRAQRSRLLLGQDPV